MMSAVLLKGFALGASNNIYCIGACAPVILPFLLSNTKGHYGHIAKYLAGRLLAYMIFAFFAGSLGIYLNGILDKRILAACMIALSLWLIFFAISRLFLEGKQTGGFYKFCSLLSKKFSGKNLSFYAGFVTGLNICPPFVLGLSEALSLASIFGAMTFFAGFYAGSSLWITAFLFVPKIAQSKNIQNLGLITSLLVGIWFLVQGISQLGFF